MSSVKIDRKTKEKLERFLTSILLDKGVKMSQKEALARMIDFALKRKEEFLESNLPLLEEDYAWKMPNKPSPPPSKAVQNITPAIWKAYHPQKGPAHINTPNRKNEQPKNIMRKVQLNTEKHQLTLLKTSIKPTLKTNSKPPLLIR